MRIVCLLVGILGFFQLTAQNPGQGDVLVLKNSIKKVINPNARVEKVLDGFQFTEGPVWHPDGYLLFSDIPANTIYKYTPGKEVEVYLKNSGFIGTDTIADGPGSNGLTMDRSGNLYICQHGARQVVKVNEAGDVQPIAAHYVGRRLNSPNDIVVRSDGLVYFTDPPWGLRGLDNDPAKELPFQGLFLLNKNDLIVLDAELSRPNGLCFSPDEDYLYVGNLDGPSKEYYRYEVLPDGNLYNKELFFSANALTGTGSPDGMKADEKGNLYFTGPGGVLVLNQKGILLGIINLPEQPANLAWGGNDGKTLYLTCRTSIYKVKVRNQGIRTWMNKK